MLPLPLKVTSNTAEKEKVVPPSNILNKLQGLKMKIPPLLIPSQAGELPEAGFIETTVGHICVNTYKCCLLSLFGII